MYIGAEIPLTNKTGKKLLIYFTKGKEQKAGPGWKPPGWKAKREAISRSRRIRGEEWIQVKCLLSQSVRKIHYIFMRIPILESS